MGQNDKERLADDARKSFRLSCGVESRKNASSAPWAGRVRSIARLLIAESSSRLSNEKNISYSVDTNVLNHLIDNGGYGLELGHAPCGELSTCLRISNC